MRNGYAKRSYQATQAARYALWAQQREGLTDAQRERMALTARFAALPGYGLAAAMLEAQHVTAQ